MRTPLTRVDGSFAEWLLELPKPAGILTPQFRTAPFVCKAALFLGLKVPEDIAIVGVDEEDICMSCDPCLTSVRLPQIRVGQKAGEMLDQMLNGSPAPTEPVIVPGGELIIRDSTVGLEQPGYDIDVALDYINDHACMGITVKDVMRTQGVSRVAFEKHFKRITGKSPGATIKERQFDRAKELLAHTQFSITTIAEMCGFSNSNYFAYRFRTTQGVPPRTYRKQHT